MKTKDPFVLVIEATSGLNTHASYITLQEAILNRDKAFKKGEDPICIYDLTTKRNVWYNQDFPPYGQTIAQVIIELYNNS